MKKTFLLFLVMVAGAFGQGSRPPINKLGQLTDVQSGTPATGDVLRWNGTQWNRVKGTYVDLSGNLLPNDMPVNLPAGSTVGTVPIGSGSSSFTLPAGKTLVVDSNGVGVDGTAVRGRIDLPYATLPKAMTDAQSGDTIELRPGTYSMPTGTAVNKAVTGLHIKGAGQGLTTIVNNDATLHSTNSTRTPLIWLTGAGGNTIEDLTISGNRSIYSGTPNYSVDGVWMEGSNNTLHNVTFTNFLGGQGFGISVCEVFLASLTSGNNNVIDHCRVEDYIGYATLLNISRGEGNKITNNHIEIGASVPFIQRPTGFGMYADGIVSGNTTNHCSVGFNTDSLLDGHVYSGVKLIGNKFENCHSGGVRMTASGNTLQIQSNYISVIEDADSWPALYVVANNFEVSGNTIDYVGTGGPVLGLVVAGSGTGIVRNNVQNAGMRSNVADAGWGGANTNVALQDNLQSDGSPMLQVNGGYVPGNIVTSTIAPTALTTSASSLTIDTATGFIRSTGINPTFTLPLVGTTGGRVASGHTVVVRNEAGSGTITVQTSNGTTVGTVPTGTSILFRAVRTSPETWTVNYQPQFPPFMVGGTNLINANTTLSVFPTFTLNIGNAVSGTVASFGVNSGAASTFSLFGATPVVKQSGDVGAAFQTYGGITPGWNYDATKVSGRVANGNLPAGATLVDSNGTTARLLAHGGSWTGGELRGEWHVTNGIDDFSISIGPVDGIKMRDSDTNETFEVETDGVVDLPSYEANAFLATDSFQTLDSIQPTTAGQALRWNGSSMELFTPQSVFVPSSSMSGTAINVTKRQAAKTISADTTFTFSATPLNGTTFGFILTNSDTAGHVITIPSSYSLTTSANRTSFTIAASQLLEVSWFWDGAVYRMAGDPAPALTVYANNAAAITGGLKVGDNYRTGADPDVVCVVH